VPVLLTKDLPINDIRYGSQPPYQFSKTKGIYFYTFKGKTHVVLFYEITSLYSYFEEI
jgi:hypothetical protein